MFGMQINSVDNRSP